MHTPRDRRKFTWAAIEKAIQDRAVERDEAFKLEGEWKKFYRKQDNFDVYLVDGVWVYNNLSVIWGHGGHGYVYEFIPLNEIWVSFNHNRDCERNEGAVAGSPLSPVDIELTIIHEIEERTHMEDGTSFWEAHNKAEQKEIEVMDEQKAGLFGEWVKCNKCNGNGCKQCDDGRIWKSAGRRRKR